MVVVVTITLSLLYTHSSLSIVDGSREYLKQQGL